MKHRHPQIRMMCNRSCRLCMSTNSNNYLDIFSSIGIEMKLNEIISEHFKCEISEFDSLPNFVCEICWQTTHTFNELYQRSKAVQQKFLNPLIKIETDTGELWPSSKETHFFEEAHVELDTVKSEPNLENEESSDNHQMNLDGHLDDSDPKSEKADVNKITRDDPVFECSKEPSESKKKRQRMSTKNITMKFTKLFKENKHRFDMTCDNCPVSFESLDDARDHYAREHNDPKGYIKCCSIKLIYPCNVINHLQKHLESKNFKCTECAKEYWTKHQLEKHMKRHTQKPEKPVRREKTVPCNICKKMFTTEQNLQYHMKQHDERHETEDGDQVKFIQEHFDLKCDHCDTVFDGFYSARQHYKNAHNDDKGYIKCCNIKLRELWIVRDHVKAHLDPDCFKCDICNKSFSSGMVLVQHKRRHRLTMQKSFICDFCGKSCRDKESITRHIFTKHVNSEPKFECEICQKKFQLEILLKNHTYAVHREKKPSVTCEKCGKSFYVKFHLDKHMLSHTDKSERLTQRKQCEYCNEWLMTKSGIYYHKQLHFSGIQKCPHCQMELANKVALLGHIRQYHREHKFKCSYCDKTFATASTMKTHSESHTRSRVYQCKYCPKSFFISSSRRTHTRRNHQEQIKRVKKKNE